MQTNKQENKSGFFSRTDTEIRLDLGYQSKSQYKKDDVRLGIQLNQAWEMAIPGK